MQLFDALSARCSYRGTYEATPVPRAHLQQIMQAGVDAPSGCNLQTTHIVAVDEPALLAQVREIFQAPIGKTAPALIFVLTRAQASINGAFYNVHDYAAATQNMLLAITGLGYQSCWIEGQLTAGDVACKLAALLGAPEDMELVCMLPVGVANGPLKRANKKDVSERAFFNGFGK